MKVALVAIAFASTSVAPAMAQDAKTVEVKPFETKPFTTISNSAQTLRDSIVQMARAQIGTKYKFGGGSPEKGFDCSGLVKFVMAALNLDVPRTAKQQAKVGLAIVKDTSRLLPGDLLTFGQRQEGRGEPRRHLRRRRSLRPSEQRRGPRHRDAARPACVSANQGLARRSPHPRRRRQHGFDDAARGRDQERQLARPAISGYRGHTKNN